MGPHGVGIALDHVQVLRVVQHQVVEQLQRELGEVDGRSGHLQYGQPVLLAERLADPTRQTAHGVRGLPTEDLRDLLTIGTVLDDLHGDVQPCFLYHAQDVALICGRVRPHYEVRSSQEVEVQGVVVDDIAHVLELPQLLGGRGRRNVEGRVQCFHGGVMVRDRAHSADPSGDYGHELRLSS